MPAASAGSVLFTKAVAFGETTYGVTPTSATVTNVVASAGTVTYTAVNSFSAGATVTITGVNPAAFNLTGVTIATASGTQFTVTNAATGTFVSGGMAYVPGTGRRLAISPTGILTPGTNIELGESRAVALRNPILSSTNVVVSQEPTVALDAPSLSLEDWVFYLQGLKAATVTGSGPYTWTYDVSMTATNSPKSYSLIVTDGVNQFLTNYSMLNTLNLSADRSGLTTARAEFFAQALTKDTSTLADTVQSAVTYLPGRLWKPYFHTSFPAVTEGTAYTYLLDWSLDITTGNARQAYQNGTLTMSTHAESEPFKGQIQLTVSGNASAISTLYDAYQAATTKYLRLEWTNGLGTTALRSANICLAFIPTDVTPIANAEDGLTTVTVQGQLVTDVTSSKTLLIELKNGLATAP